MPFHQQSKHPNDSLSVREYLENLYNLKIQETLQHSHNLIHKLRIDTIPKRDKLEKYLNSKLN